MKIDLRTFFASLKKKGSTMLDKRSIVLETNAVKLVQKPDYPAVYRPLSI